MPAEDVQMTRRVQREIVRRQSVEPALLMVRVMHGVAYLTGNVAQTRGGAPVNLQEEMHIITQNIRRIPGIRDVMVDVRFSH